MLAQDAFIFRLLLKMTVGKGHSGNHYFWRARAQTFIVTPWRALPIADRPLPIADRPIAGRPLPIADRPIAGRPLPIAEQERIRAPQHKQERIRAPQHRLPVGHCRLPIGHCRLPIGHLVRVWVPSPHHASL